MTRYINADKYMAHLRANIDTTADIVNEQIKRDEPIGTVKDGGQIGYLWALQWARNLLELDCFTVEAIPKDEYMVAMLTEIQLEIEEEKRNTEHLHYDDLENAESYNTAIDNCIDIIQQKINSLKSESEKK